MLRHVTSPDGVRIAVEVEGSGPPLVLVHGSGSARWSMDGVRPLLASRFTVHVPDRRGRGDSADGAGHSIAREVADVIAIVRSAGAGGALVGHSYGGLLAAGAAPDLPGLRGLVLYEPPAGGTLVSPGYVDHLEELIARGELDAMLETYLTSIPGLGKDSIDAARGTPLWEWRRAVAPTVPRELHAAEAHRLDAERLAAIATPTLLLVGSESPHWAVRATAAYAEAMPRAEVRRLDGHGHAATVTAPDLLAAEILAFLAPDPEGA